jgi:hypothetical protein
MDEERSVKEGVAAMFCAEARVDHAESTRYIPLHVVFGFKEVQTHELCTVRYALAKDLQATNL